eukprot:5214606-Alexandrium_andersonii.AAC.1
MSASLVGSEMCISDRPTIGSSLPPILMLVKECASSPSTTSRGSLCGSPSPACKTWMVYPAST